MAAGGDGSRTPGATPRVCARRRHASDHRQRLHSSVMGATSATTYPSRPDRSGSALAQLRIFGHLHDAQRRPCLWPLTSGHVSLAQGRGRGHPPRGHPGAGGFDRHRRRSASTCFRLYNVFAAAKPHGAQRVVYASSRRSWACSLRRAALCSSAHRRDAPHPRPESSTPYAKLAGRDASLDQFTRRTRPALRIAYSNIMVSRPTIRPSRATGGPSAAQVNLWGYVDARDVRHGLRAGPDRATLLAVTRPASSLPPTRA